MIDTKKILMIKRIIGFLAMWLLYDCINLGGMKKYAIAMVLFAVFCFFGRKRAWDMDVLLCVALPVGIYTIFGGMSGMLQGTYQMSTVKLFVFCLLPLLLAFSMYVFYGKDLHWMMEAQFLSCCIVYGIPCYKFFAVGHMWESTFAFSFGVFAIYYAYRKRILSMALALTLCYFAGKRIALLGVGAVLLVMAVSWLFQNNKKLILAVWGTAIAAIYGYLYLIYSGILDAFCWGANINTNGRVTMYTRMAEEAKFSPLYFGKGLGVVETLLENWNISTYVNLHNDILKFYIELGFFGLLLYLLSYCVLFLFAEKNFDTGKMCFLFGMSLYSLLLFVTDNVSIYIMYLLPVYCSFFAVLSSGRKVKNLREDL